jgi:hypothetical protein
MTDDANRPIGSATMTEDGTLVLDLVAEGPGGLRGIARILRPPSHPRYAAWIEHLGGIRPGEEKLVPPWPQTATGTP